MRRLGTVILSFSTRIRGQAWYPLHSSRVCPKDASAAAVVASALTELSGYVDSAKGKEYMEAAKAMIADLSSKRYQSRGKNSAFLMHSTGHHPAGSEIDASIIYADY